MDVTTKDKMGSLWLVLYVLSLFTNEFVQAQQGLQPPADSGSLSPGDLQGITFGGFNLPQDTVSDTVMGNGPVLDVASNSGGFIDQNTASGNLQDQAVPMDTSVSDVASALNSGMPTLDITGSNTGLGASNVDTFQGFNGGVPMIDIANSGVVDPTANNLPINSASLTIGGQPDNRASIHDPVAASMNIAGPDTVLNTAPETMMFFPKDMNTGSNTGSVDTTATDVAGSSSFSGIQTVDINTHNQQTGNTAAGGNQMFNTIKTDNQPLFKPLVNSQSSTNILSNTDSNYQFQPNGVQNAASSNSLGSMNNNFAFSNLNSGQNFNDMSSTKTIQTNTVVRDSTSSSATFGSKTFSSGNSQEPVVRQDLKGSVVLKQFLPLGHLGSSSSDTVATPKQVSKALKSSGLMQNVFKPTDTMTTVDQGVPFNLPNNDRTSMTGSILEGSNLPVIPDLDQNNLIPQNAWQPSQNRCDTLRIKPYIQDERFYLELVFGDSWIKRRCAPGTSFVRSSCECSNVIPWNPFESKRCAPDLWMDYDYGMQDLSGYHYAPEDYDPRIQLNKGAMCLPGQSALRIPRYNSFDFSNKLYISLRFKADNVTRRNNPYPVITNCEGGYSEPSVGVVLIRGQNVVAIFIKTTRGMAFHTYNITAGDWNRVTLKYDGYYLTSSVNGQMKPPKIVTGIIKTLHEPLMLGYCGRYGYFKGCIDDVMIYHCIPPGV